MVLTATSAKHKFVGDYKEFWIDTRAEDPGPEFVVLDQEAPPYRYSVYRVADFRRLYWLETPGPATCTRLRIAWPDVDASRLRVPRRCFATMSGKKPARLRVSLRSYGDFGDPTDSSDWAPDYRTFGRWAARGVFREAE